MEEFSIFVENVREMRRMQKLYNRTHDYIVFRKMQNLEVIVDKGVEKWELSEKKEPMQLDLGL